MIRIICAKCKNAYLQKAEGNLTCPSCDAVFSEKEENLLSGIQFYTEGDCEKANDCLMKYIVQEGAEPRAILVKALCDASDSDEDTYSLKSMYEKLSESLAEIPDEWFPSFLAMANDGAEKIEKSLVKKHIALFEDADAEKIKKEVTTIITLQNDAKEFRNALKDLVFEYNNRSAAKLSVRFSDCFLVEPEVSTEVGNRKYEKITGNIASHTVFTGSLSTDIKNLEIYYRCIVMFFRKNREKYDFLMVSAEKFAELSRLLEEGQYNTIKGTSAIGDKLKSAAYDFFQESLKDHDEDEEELQSETVVILEPEVIEISVEENDESAEATEDVYENISSTDAPLEAEEEPEFEDISSSSAEESSEEESEEAFEDEDTISLYPSTDDSDDAELEPETEENKTEEIAEAEEICEESEEIQNENEDETPEAAPSITATLTKIDKSNVDVIPDDTPSEEETEEESAEAEENESNEKPVRAKHKKHYKPFVAVLLIIVAIGIITAIRVIPPKIRADKYNTAAEYAKQEQYDKAAALYAELGNYEDSEKLYLENTYAYAEQLAEHKNFAAAADVYNKLGDYLNSVEMVKFCIYSDAIDKLNAGKYDEAKGAFDTIPDYKDSATQASKCLYKKAEELIANQKYTAAVEILETIISYDESVADMILDAQYKYVTEHLDPEDETTMVYIVNLVSANYLDSVSLRDFLVSSQDPAISTDPEADTPDNENDTEIEETTTPTEGSVSIYTNTSKSDTETNTTDFDSDRAIHIHIECLDESLYGKELTMTYENKYSHANLRKKVFTEEDNSYVFTYSGDGTSNYDITFRLVDAEGNVVAEQTVSVN